MNLTLMDKIKKMLNLRKWTYTDKLLKNSTLSRYELTIFAKNLTFFITTVHRDKRPHYHSIRLVGLDGEEFINWAAPNDAGFMLNLNIAMDEADSIIIYNNKR